ncbi:MAG: hypothetical protein HY696_02365 [Deltaproteobacteria bacterium]|nr:hypothetical protein [Deltaproteobacteria bacterium]
MLTLKPPPQRSNTQWRALEKLRAMQPLIRDGAKMTPATLVRRAELARHMAAGDAAHTSTALEQALPALEVINDAIAAGDNQWRYWSAISECVAPHAGWLYADSPIVAKLLQHGRDLFQRRCGGGWTQPLPEGDPGALFNIYYEALRVEAAWARDVPAVWRDGISELHGWIVTGEIAAPASGYLGLFTALTGAAHYLEMRAAVRLWAEPPPFPTDFPPRRCLTSSEPPLAVRLQAGPQDAIDRTNPRFQVVPWLADRVLAPEIKAACLLSGAMLVGDCPGLRPRADDSLLTPEVMQTLRRWLQVHRLDETPAISAAEYYALGLSREIWSSDAELYPDVPR